MSYSLQKTIIVILALIIQWPMGIRAEGWMERQADWLRFLPAAGYVGMGFLPGVSTRSDVSTRLLAGATAFAVSTAVTGALKQMVNERRPDGGDRHSFPSGHAAVAFTGAELMRMEYGTWAGVGAYAVATTVGVLRVTARRHYVHDVLAGAVVGVLSAHIGYWLAPYERRLLGLEKRGTQALVFPAVGGSGEASIGICCMLVY